jgi:hypothetical protein
MEVETVMVEESSPKSIDEIVASLKGFGITDFEEILTVKVGPKELRLRIANLPTEEEMNSLFAVEEYKGYAWVQHIKCEILSRSISWINGIDIRNLTSTQRMVVDPTDKEGVQKDIQVVLRNLLMGWGQELVGVLWKVLMVHAQRITDRLYEQFPDSAIMTEYEKRFMEHAQEEIEQATADNIRQQISEMYDPEIDTPPTKPESEVKRRMYDPEVNFS